MVIKTAGGVKENGVIVGNTYDKYGSKNIVVRKLMKGFEKSLTELVQKVSPNSIHEVGCGEGYWVLRWADQGIASRGSDFSSEVIRLARENGADQNVDSERFLARSIYDLKSSEDSADLIVCCEVLEHLEYPEAALESLRRVVKGHLIISVPREPIWCALNLARGKYIKTWGNTPGHIQHWSKGAFINLVSRYFNVIEIRTPFPWTMLLCSSRS